MNYLLDIVREPGVVSIIEGYKTDIEDMEIIESCENNWWSISYKDLSIEFIERWKDNLKFSVITKYIKLPESFIDENISKFDFTQLAEFQKHLSTKFIEKYHDKVNWKKTLYNSTELDEVFLKKWVDIKLGGVNNVLRARLVSENFIETYAEVLDWKALTKSVQRMSVAFIDKWLHKMKIDDVVKFKSLNEDFILKHEKNIKWPLVAQYQDLSESFIEKHIEKLDWVKISTFQKLSEKFIEKYSEEVCWKNISKRQILSEKFIEKWRDRVVWSSILRSQRLSHNFRRKWKYLA